jgi:hypothetical protein
MPLQVRYQLSLGAGGYMAWSRDLGILKLSHFTCPVPVVHSCNPASHTVPIFINLSHRHRQ